MAKCAAIVEADQFAIVFFFSQLDAFGAENLVECEEMQRLAVYNYAIEIEEDGKGPIGHCGMIIGVQRRWQSR